MNDPIQSRRSPSLVERSQLRGASARATVLLGAVAASVLATSSAAAESEGHSIGSVIVIAMENHNFTQPDPTSAPQQILGNPAAPYLNSLVTPGTPNSTQVSYAVSYHNAGHGVHPSEPNYVWAEAGTDFGVHTDADPSAAANNIFTADHFTAQLNAAGISWNNYEEDVELSTSAIKSASGTTGPINPYYGTTQFNYAVKHNPMAFFPDTATANVWPLDQFFVDLATGALARYSWITPNQFNDAHSALKGGFTYHGTLFTGDQSSVAQGDNFLATVVPQIMASSAYQENGVIVIWWDESEDGDGLDRAIPEIVISPLAKGNAYASSVELNHSSDLKTWEIVFGAPFLSNAIPATETNAAGTGFNDVATVNDLSDLFVPGSIHSSPDQGKHNGDK